jgi:hypothetical protein
MGFPYTPRHKRNRKVGDSSLPASMNPANLLTITAATSGAPLPYTLAFDRPMGPFPAQWPPNWSLNGSSNFTITAISGSTVTAVSAASAATNVAFNFPAQNTLRSTDGSPVNPKTGTTA